MSVARAPGVLSYTLWMRLRRLFPLALLVACGGTAAIVDGGASDGSIADGGADAAVRDGGVDACPSGTEIPDAAIYACDAAARDGASCPAAAGDPNASRNPNRYPMGCVVTLPVQAGFCSGPCCGPQTCNCELGAPGSGPQFVCPL